MAIITQTDKRSGITYAYETEYYWDKEKKQSRSKRICVGKVDPATGEIVPTRGRAKKGETKAAIPSSGKTGPKPFVESKHLYYGARITVDDSADAGHVNTLYLYMLLCRHRGTHDLGEGGGQCHLIAEIHMSTF